MHCGHKTLHHSIPVHLSETRHPQQQTTSTLSCCCCGCYTAVSCNRRRGGKVEGRPPRRRSPVDQSQRGSIGSLHRRQPIGGLATIPSHPIPPRLASLAESVGRRLSRPYDPDCVRRWQLTPVTASGSQSVGPPSGGPSPLHSIALLSTKRENVVRRTRCVDVSRCIRSCDASLAGRINNTQAYCCHRGAVLRLNDHLVARGRAEIKVTIRNFTILSLCRGRKCSCTSRWSF